MRGWIRNSGSRCSGLSRRSNFGPTGLVMEERYVGLEGRLMDVLANFAEGSLKAEKHRSLRRVAPVGIWC